MTHVHVLCACMLAEDGSPAIVASRGDAHDGEEMDDPDWAAPQQQHQAQAHHVGIDADVDADEMAALDQELDAAMSQVSDDAGRAHA